MDPAKQIEAILFFKGEPVSFSTLAQTLKSSPEEIRAHLDTLGKELAGRGIRLIRGANTVELRTAPELSDLIASMRKDELEKDLGKAGLETLSVVLYRGPVTRAQVDYIRGVNSTYMLRHLLVRGLIEKVPNPKDNRSYLYRPTLELLGHLGISAITELSDYETARSQIEAFEKKGAETQDE